MPNKVEYWIQQKRGFGDWFDYSEKKDLHLANLRVEELNKEKQEPEFRVVIRRIDDSLVLRVKD